MNMRRFLVRAPKYIGSTPRFPSSCHRFSTQDAPSVELELWNSPVCPFGQRAWWTVLHKQIPTDKYIIHWEDLGNKSDTFKSAYKQSLFANPEKDGTVPTIKHKGKYITGTVYTKHNYLSIISILYFHITHIFIQHNVVACIKISKQITESDVCSKYIDKAFGGASLVPSDPYKELLMESKVKQHFGSIMGSLFGVLQQKDLKGDNLLLALQNFNSSLNQVSKEGFLFGNEFTLFEILVFPIFFRFEALEALTDVPVKSQWLNSENESNSVEAKSLARVINWYNNVNSMESVNQMRKISTFEILKDSYDELRSRM